MRARSYDSNETFDAETRVDGLDAHKLTRLSLEHGVLSTMRWYTANFCFHRSIVSKSAFSIGGVRRSAIQGIG